jgi:hypothetical protein
MLRLTAKSTQFGRKTFTSWLIESAGTVPIKRRKDFAEGDADNSEVMEKLIQVKIRHACPSGCHAAHRNLAGTRRW